MAHQHHEDDSYYVDQLCMVAISATFAAVCLALYCWQKQMLSFLLVSEQLRLCVLASGVVLMILALMRGWSLWVESAAKPGDESSSHRGKLPMVHDHAHDHAHDHTHDHTCSHDHPHDHTHADHSHADHEHASAPWRYVVMLVPVILFMLGLPNKGPSAGAFAGADGEALHLA